MKHIFMAEAGGYYTVFCKKGKEYFLILKRERKNKFLNFVLGGKPISTYGFGRRAPLNKGIMTAHSYLINTYT